MRRVVVTGMGGVTALGSSWPAIRQAMEAGRTATRYMPEWDYITDLNTRLGAPIDGYHTPAHYPRRALRSMGRVAVMSIEATEAALRQSGLLEERELLRGGGVGVAYGSSTGSVDPICAIGKMVESGSLDRVTSTTYIEMMSHTAAVNIALFFGLTGRIIPTSSACTSGSQGIGYAAEAIRYGRQEVMIAGGAEELSAAGAAVFDTLFATSTRNQIPHTTPRPFDRDRDGLVVGEGAATLILENREHALARGATILAELVGFATNSDGRHVTQPESATMAIAIRGALDDAGLTPDAIGYISAHGTATDRGDVAESQATAGVLGDRVPVSSLKGYYGHTLGACGAIEAWLMVEMMRNDWFAPTANLINVADECAGLDHLLGSGRSLQIEYAMSNNFAFGGINTSLIFRQEV
jgi:3-oxoacyl-[acyl-carrier-protein] synthase II